MSYSYQWKRGGVAISGATSSSYLLVTADLAAMISCTVTATNVAGSANATAAAVGPVTAAAANSITASAGAFALSGKSATLTLTPASGAYTGPGEVTGWGTAYGYWGLRAYNASKIGANCIDVCANQTGAAVSLTTVVIGSDGYANLTPIGFSPIYVNRIYDQASSQDLFSAGPSRPPLVSSMVGGKPAIYFTGGGTCWMSTSANATAQIQPLTVAAVSRSNTYVSSGLLFSDGSFNFQAMFNGASARMGQYLGVFIDNHVNVADNNFASVISVCNNNLGGIAINGVFDPATGNVGTNGIAGANKITIGATDGGAVTFDGYVYEFIVKAGAKNSTEMSALNTNQHAIGTGWT